MASARLICQHAGVVLLSVVLVATCGVTCVAGAPGFRHLLVPRWDPPLNTETRTVRPPRPVVVARLLCVVDVLAVLGSRAAVVAGYRPRSVCRRGSLTQRPP